MILDIGFMFLIQVIKTYILHSRFTADIDSETIIAYAFVLLKKTSISSDDRLHLDLI